MFKNLKILLGTSFLYLLLSNQLIAQKYNYKRFNEENGLSQNYVYDFVQDKYGFVWVATGNGLNKLDGNEIEKYDTLSGLANNFISCLLSSSDGRIWCGHNEGSISVSSGLGFISYKEVGKSLILKLIDLDSIYVASISQSGNITLINKQTLKANSISLTAEGAFGNVQFYSAIALSAGKILVSTDKGYFKVFFNEERNNILRITKPSGLPEKGADKIIQTQNKKGFVFYVNGKVYRVYTKGKESFQSNLYKDLTRYEINGVKSIMLGNANEIWLSSYSGAYKIDFNKQVIRYSSANGLETDYVQSVFQDREDNIWIGSYGSGVFIAENEFIKLYNQDTKDVPSDVTAIYVGPSIKLFGLNKGMLRIDKSLFESQKYYNEGTPIEDEKVTAIVQSKKGDFYIGTNTKGLYSFNLEKEQFKKVQLRNSDATNSINHLACYNDSLFVSTKDGLYIINLSDNSILELNTDKGLPHNNIKTIFRKSNGHYLIGGTFNSLIETTNFKQWNNIPISNKFGLLDVISIDEDHFGKIWVATFGSGVFKQDLSLNFEQVSELKNPDLKYPTNLRMGFNYNVWVSYANEIIRYNYETNVREIYDNEYGIVGNVNLNASLEDSDSCFWFGLSNGCVKFEPRALKRSKNPPNPVLKAVYINDSLVNFSDVIKLKAGYYRIKLEFVGITFNNSDKVTYSYVLDGYEDEWISCGSQNFAAYPRLSEGIYEFKLFACDVNGICSEKVKLITIIIDKPFYKTTWFIILTVLVVISIFVAIVKFRENIHKRQVEYLDAELKIRAKEVLESRDLLERKNKDITDSINYAKRIQTAILPEMSKVKKELKRGFILNLPRDIVSGDFYWMRRIGDKILFVIADCTGHGVPGGFMSMIGSTLLNEVTTASNYLSPSATLTHLDSAVKETLKSRDAGEIYEGMDLVFLEINFNENYIVFSGAMRPLILQNESGVHVIQGSKYSIGGNFDFEKKFTNNKIKVSPGDKIFAFSDGYQDQFGGPLGKKIKLSGIIDLVKANQGIDIGQMEYKFLEHLMEWMKDGDPQIDDILVVGIEF
ncbi:MAG: two-component regulator propeller domain-containing protein [Bacteroidia bacterium]